MGWNSLNVKDNARLFAESMLIHMYILYIHIILLNKLDFNASSGFYCQQPSP